MICFENGELLINDTLPQTRERLIKNFLKGVKIMVLTNCNSCVHKSVCKYTSWATSEFEKKIDFSEYTSRGFRAEVVVECMNFHSEMPTTYGANQTPLSVPCVKKQAEKKPVENDDYKTIDEAAKVLGLKYTDVRKLIVDGKLKAKKNVLIGNRWEIPTKEIERYQASVA